MAYYKAEDVLITNGDLVTVRTGNTYKGHTVDLIRINTNKEFLHEMLDARSDDTIELIDPNGDIIESLRVTDVNSVQMELDKLGINSPENQRWFHAGDHLNGFIIDSIRVDVTQRTIYFYLLDPTKDKYQLPILYSYPISYGDEEYIKEKTYIEN